MLGKILRTHWELERNIERTHWEHILYINSLRPSVTEVLGGGGRERPVASPATHDAQEFLEEVQQQFSCSANVFFLLSSPAYVSSPSRALSLSLLPRS